MSEAALYLRASGAILKRDALIFWSYRFRVVGDLLSVVLSMTLFYYLSRLVTGREFPSPADYFAFAAVGLLTLAVLTATVGALPMMLRQELVAGTFERLVASPMGGAASVVAMTLFPFLNAFAMAAAALAFASIAFGLPLHWSTVPLALPIALLGALAFAPFAVLLTGLTLAFKQAAVGAGFILTVVSLVTGSLFPTALLPGWIKWAADVQPFTPAIELLRHCLVGSPMSSSALAAVLKLLFFAAVVFPLSVLMLRAAVEFCRRRGTVTEY